MAESVVVETGTGGLPRARMTAARAEAEVYLHGGHVTHWQPQGTAPVLFLSARSAYAPGKAIRGGVPIIFPWFGARAGHPQAPQHGFARSRAWQLLSSGPGPAGTAVLELGLEDDEASRAAWPSTFRARYRVSVGDTLEMALEVVNTSPAPFTFEAALHTYLAVGDIRAVGVTGLEQTTYIDKVDRMARKRHGAEPLRLTGETDRVFLGTTARCVVDDRALDRRLIVGKTGSASTVVWNPWATKAAGIADLEPEDWRRMICVETANAADDAVTLPAGGRHVMTATLRVE